MTCNAATSPRDSVPFLRDKRGTIAVLFALASFMTMVVSGIAVDMARWVSARAVTKSAIDSAVLAGARMLQVSGRDAALAIDTAVSFYRENTRSRALLARDTIGFDVSEDGTAVMARGEAALSTVVMKMFGIGEIPLLKASGEDHAKATFTFGINAVHSLEVVLVLDVSRSMAGSRMTSVRQAAKTLIDMVVWNGDASERSRMALVPFADTVRLSDDLHQQVIRDQDLRGLPKTVRTAAGYPATWFVADRCVAERQGADAFGDAPPDDESRRFAAVYALDGACHPSRAEALPLTSNTAALKDRIDDLRASGGTAAHIGMAWAWYLLSPRWAGVLPADAAPQSYADLSRLNAHGRPVLRKIAILFSDGASDTEYCATGIRARHPGAEAWTADCAAPNGPSSAQARELCSSMKASGITIFTVGLGEGADGTAADTLGACASSQDHAYWAADKTELHRAFRGIGVRITAFYLSA